MSNSDRQWSIASRLNTMPFDDSKQFQDGRERAGAMLDMTTGAFMHPDAGEQHGTGKSAVHA
jgi:hypothetical protein